MVWSRWDLQRIAEGPASAASELRVVEVGHMSIHEGLAALSVRPDADPIYIHNVCRQVLKEHVGLGNPDRRLLKCDACDQVIGEWDSEADMRTELQAWWRIMKNRSMKARKQRFSPGRRVMVGMGMRVGTVKTVADHPSVLGEFVHEVLVDGENEPRRVVGCDLQPLPGMDEDLHKGSSTSIHLQNSSIANLNLGTQVGTINAVVQAMQGEGDAQRQVARALEELAQAVLSSQTTLPESEKLEVLDSLTTIAEQAAKKPEERSKGTLKAIFGYLPTAISAASNLASLWDKVGPTIKGYLGL